MDFEDFKIRYGRHLQKEKVEALKGIHEMLSMVDITERQIAFGLKSCLPFIAYSAVSTDLELLRKCGLSELIFRYFQSYESVCESLNPIFENCSFEIDFEQVFVKYEKYMADFYFSLFNLESGIGFNTSKIVKNLSRQSREGRWDKGLSEEEKLDFQIIIDSYRENLSILDYSFKENDMIPNIQRCIKFPHKVWFQTLYKRLFAENEGANESDFKVFFFDLIKILIADKSVLKDDFDSRANYSSTRRFKIKRVERLILS